VKARVDKISGASGEVSALLAARTDLARWQSGDARLVNMVPLAEGARTRRPGTRFVLPLKDEARPGQLADFEASATDSYQLVLNAGVVRLLRGGGFVETSPGVPFEFAHPFPDASLPAIQTAQSVNQMFIAWGGRPQRLTRRSALDWVIEEYPVVEAPVRVQNTDKASTITASAVSGTVTLTASQPVFLPGHAGSVWRFDEADLSDPPAWKALEAVTVGARRRNRGLIYEAVVAGVDTGPNAPTHDDGDASSGAGNTTWRFIHTVSGFVRITAITSATVATGEVVKRLPDSIASTGTFRWYEAAWSDVRGWPKSVCLFDGSVVWARGNEVWVSKPTDIYSYDDTIVEDGAWSAPLLSPDGKLVEIEWLLPAGVLLAGARASIWVLRGKDTYERITTQTLRAVPQPARGSGTVPAAIIEGGAIYVGRSRREASFARFDALGDRVEITDLTPFARRALWPRAAQIADQRDPYRIVWFRLDDGTLRGLVYIPEQEVLGWCRASTRQGVIEQIGCIQSADEAATELWLIVRRTINGQTRRYIEVMCPFFVAPDEDAPDAAEAWFVDCGLRYQGAATTTISGLAHLEGETVAVHADGDEHPRCVVTGGAITLQRAASDVIVGLPLDWRIRTLPLDFSGPRGTSRGIEKSTARVAVQVLESAAGRIWQVGTPDRTSPIIERGQASAGVPRALTNGSVMATVETHGDRDCALELGDDSTLPFTLLALTPDVDVRDA
jgi:hypothetical protein